MAFLVRKHEPITVRICSAHEPHVDLMEPKQFRHHTLARFWAEHQVRKVRNRFGGGLIQIGEDESILIDPASPRHLLM